MGTKCRIFHSIWGKVREREREEEELEEDRGEGEKNGNGGEKAEFRLFRKLIIRPPNSFLEYFQFLSLSLFNELERTRREFFSVPRHAFEFRRKGGGGGYKNISLRLEKSYRRILRALYLINRTNSSFHSLPFFERSSFGRNRVRKTELAAVSTPSSVALFFSGDWSRSSSATNYPSAADSSRENWFISIRDRANDKKFYRDTRQSVPPPLPPYLSLYMNTLPAIYGDSFSRKEILNSWRRRRESGSKRCPLWSVEEDWRVLKPVSGS